MQTQGGERPRRRKARGRDEQGLLRHMASTVAELSPEAGSYVIHGFLPNTNQFLVPRLPWALPAFRRVKMKWEGLPRGGVGDAPGTSLLGIPARDRINEAPISGGDPVSPDCLREGLNKVSRAGWCGCAGWAVLL